MRLIIEFTCIDGDLAIEHFKTMHRISGKNGGEAEYWINDFKVNKATWEGIQKYIKKCCPVAYIDNTSGVAVYRVGGKDSE